MRIYIETLLLYIILFFSGSVTSTAKTGVIEGFSAVTELAKIFLYIIPSIALIWYMLLREKQVKNWNIKPGKNDLFSGITAFPCLLMTGFAIVFVSSRFGYVENETLAYPSANSEWAVLGFYCICSAYLEESFFRFYILSRRHELKLDAISAAAFSAVLFSICHIYEGPWGVLNAFLSAIILALIFLRYKALHGIAIAHGLYNISVFAINAFFNKA